MGLLTGHLRLKAVHPGLRATYIPEYRQKRKFGKWREGHPVKTTHFGPYIQSLKIGHSLWITPIFTP